MRGSALLHNCLEALLAGAFALGLVVWPVSLAHAEEGSAMSQADLTFFYKAPSPERAARLITYLDALRLAEKHDARAVLIGFFAAVFQQYPVDVGALTAGSMSPQMMGLLAVSLRLAGRQDKAPSLLEKLKARDAVVPDLARIPASLEAVEALGTDEFDLLWGASFATGDPRYCAKVLGHFAAVANVGDNADDILRLTRDLESGADQQWIVRKRGRDKAQELIIGSIALWSVHSNELQHPFVKRMIDSYVSAHPDEHAAKAVMALAREYGHYQLARLVSVTKTVSGEPTATVDLAYLSRILDDLGRHASSYPPHFEFADDRQRAERDVAAISRMLDPLTENLSKNPPLLLRLAVLHVMGHNLDVPDCAPRAVRAFKALLRLTPDDPETNYRYGSFLAASTRKGEGIPFLEKAKSLGVPDADYWLGWSYESIGEKTKALENLTTYTKRVPSDRRAAELLQAIRNDKVGRKMVELRATP